MAQTFIELDHLDQRSVSYSTEPSRLDWPYGVLSLSHIALPFPPDDPLYGRPELRQGDGLHLGPTAIQGERGLLKLPADGLLRLRRNPFFEVVEEKVVEWVEGEA